VTVVHGTVDATGEKKEQFKEVGKNLEKISGKKFKFFKH